MEPIKMFSALPPATKRSRQLAITNPSIFTVLASLLITTACVGVSASNSKTMPPAGPPVTTTPRIPPTLTLTATPLSGTAPLTVAFLATCSTCVAYTWSFGDGGTDPIPEPNQTYTYQSAGSWTAIVAATDKYGNGATGFAIINVAQQVVGNPCGKPLFSCVNRTVGSLPVPSTPPNAGGPDGANTYMVDPDFHNIIV